MSEKKAEVVSQAPEPEKNYIPAPGRDKWKKGKKDVQGN